MPKISKETLLIVASNLTVAEMIHGFEKDSELLGQDPAPHVDDVFKKRLERLEAEYL